MKVIKSGEVTLWYEQTDSSHIADWPLVVNASEAVPYNSGAGTTALNTGWWSPPIPIEDGLCHGSSIFYEAKWTSAGSTNFLPRVQCALVVDPVEYSDWIKDGVTYPTEFDDCLLQGMQIDRQDARAWAVSVNNTVADSGNSWTAGVFAGGGATGGELVYLPIPSGYVAFRLALTSGTVDPDDTVTLSNFRYAVCG